MDNQDLKIEIDGVGKDWRQHELKPRETVSGEVLRLPVRGAFNGNSLFLETDDGVIAIPATASRGHTLLERALSAKRIQVGDTIEVTFEGFAETQDGERSYRFEEVRRVRR